MVPELLASTVPKHGSGQPLQLLFQFMSFPAVSNSEVLAYQQQNLFVPDLVWTTDPSNSSAVRNGEEAFEAGENMGDAV